MQLPELQVTVPEWVPEHVDLSARLVTQEERMRLVIGLARENVLRGTGGPFAAAVFESRSGALVSVGLNVVVPVHCSMLHGEVVAIALAQRRLESFTLRAPGLPAHELVSSCDPCAMCLGATLWSGVRRLVCGADRDDAARVGFEEGPVFPDSYAYLADRGIEVVRGVLREEAAEVLRLYDRSGGVIYNG